MSFIEKNKVWLLPLLGMGVLGVGYMNFRNLQSDQPATAVASGAPAPEQAPAPQAPPGPQAPQAPPAVPGEASEGSAESGDLWGDLKPFAVLPGNLAQEDALRKRARLALDPDLGEEGTVVLGRPAWASLSAAAPKVAGGEQATVEESAPEIEFLIHGSRGSFAWFDGRGYHSGEKLQGSAYIVSRIGATSVELSGPHGKLLETTIPTHDAGPKSRQTPEAP